MNGYKIKQLPEDFIVTEQYQHALQERGRFAYFLLEKRERNTLDIIRQLAHLLQLWTKEIGFAGNKDKHAVTSQVISLPAKYVPRMEGIIIDKAKFSLLGYASKPVSLGELTGNHFQIIVRHLTEKSAVITSFVANYFDEQRFSQNNAAIGKALLVKDFKTASTLIDAVPVRDHLAKLPNDYIGALKLLPLRLLRLYVNAYQSYLWNIITARYLLEKSIVFKRVKYSLGEFVFVKQPIPDLRIALPGFTGSSQQNEQLQAICNTLLADEGISSADFVIKQIPELSLEGELRNVFVEIQDLKIGLLENDELNQGKQKCQVTFSLPKGSYATIVVKKLFAEKENAKR